MPIPIALQLYSVRGECSKDLAETLKTISKIGYQGVEPWGYRGDANEWMKQPAKDIRKMLDDNGLACCGFHVATDAIRPDNLARSIEFNQTLGNRFLIISGDKNRMSSAGGISELAGILNDAALKLAPHGMSCGYHAHGFDFTAVDGKTPWDELASQTRPEVVMQMDTANCMAGGGDPIASLQKFPGRARTIHLKEHGAHGVIVGEGTVKWPEVFRLCETVEKTQWYIVEEESTKDGLGFDQVRRTLEALRRMGK